MKYDFSSMVFTLMCYDPSPNGPILRHSLSFYEICEHLLKAVDLREPSYDTKIQRYYVVCAPRISAYIPQQYVIGVINKQAVVTLWTPNGLTTSFNASSQSTSNNTVGQRIFNPDDVDQDPSCFAYELHLECKAYNEDREQSMSKPLSTVSKVHWIQDDMLTSTYVQCIFQQCNCLAVRPHGLSAAIAKRYPYANVYEQRQPVGRRNLAHNTDRPKPGTCKLMMNTSNEPGPIVACLFGQYQYGKSGQYAMGDLVPDSVDDREQYFWNALEDFDRQSQQLTSPIRTLGFPHMIGCGLAGGNWTTYSKMIEDFAQLYPQYTIFVFQVNDS